MHIFVYILQSSLQGLVHLVQPLRLGHLWRRGFSREREHPACSGGSLPYTRWGAEHRKVPRIHKRYINLKYTFIIFEVI